MQNCCKSKTTILEAGVVVLLLFLALYAGSSCFLTDGICGGCFTEFVSILRTGENQWLAVLCCSCYLAACLVITSGKARCEQRRVPGGRDCLLVIFYCAGLSNYLIHYDSALRPMQALAFFTSVVFGRITFAWLRWNDDGFEGRAIILINGLVFLLVLGPLWQHANGRGMQYGGIVRWSGAWGNPNLFGSLMGCGIVLAVGRLIVMHKIRHGGAVCSKRFVTSTIFFLAAFFFMLHGLLCSFSRGAWMGTLWGLFFLVICILRSQSGGPSQKEILAGVPVAMSRLGRIIICSHSWIAKNLVVVAVGSCAVMVLANLHSGRSEWHLVRRAFSATNMEDFSWRNRIAAWKGALQITAEFPWFGAGWNQPQLLYQHQYLSSKLSESAAIEMNDCTLIGAGLGIPTLCIIGIYVWLSFFRRPKYMILNQENGRIVAELSCLEWQRTSCRAGAIVLLVGFWFDGGLFELPTAATFWILLELGSAAGSGGEKLETRSQEMASST